MDFSLSDLYDKSQWLTVLATEIVDASWNNWKWLFSTRAFLLKKILWNFFLVKNDEKPFKSRKKDAWHFHGPAEKITSAKLHFLRTFLAVKKKQKEDMNWFWCLIDVFSLIFFIKSGNIQFHALKIEWHK